MTEKTNKITSTQLCLILLGVFIAMRPILENALQADIVGNDCIIISIIAGIINLGLALLICYVVNKNPGKSFFEIMSNALGSVVTKIIMLILGVIFAFKMLLIDYQMTFLLYDAIYADINWYLVTIPIFITMCFIAIKGIKVLARCYQIFLPFTLIILILTLFIGYFNANFENLLPLFNHTVGQMNQATGYLLLQSCEYIFLLTFMENVDVKSNKYFLKIIPTLIIIFLLVITFYIFFIGVLGNLAPFVQENLIKITQFKNNSSGYFKIDIFTTVFWIPLIILQNSFCLYSISYCLNKAFNINRTISSVVLIIALLATKFVPQINNQAIIEFFYNQIGIFIIAFVLLIPILLLLASFKKEKNNEN